MIIRSPSKTIWVERTTKERGSRSIIVRNNRIGTSTRVAFIHRDGLGNGRTLACSTGLAPFFPQRSSMGMAWAWVHWIGFSCSHQGALTGLGDGVHRKEEALVVGNDSKGEWEGPASHWSLFLRRASSLPTDCLDVAPSSLMMVWNFMGSSCSGRGRKACSLKSPSLTTTVRTSKPAMRAQKSPTITNRNSYAITFNFSNPSSNGPMSTFNKNWPCSIVLPTPTHP